MNRLLDALPVVPGSRRESVGAAFGLTGPTSLESGATVVTRVWIGTGTTESAQRYIGAHLPRGLTPDGSASGTDVPPNLNYAVGSRWQQPSLYTDPMLELTFAQRDGRVAVRADVQAVALPVKTADQTITQAVSSVDILVRSRGRDWAPKQFDATVAVRLVRHLDALVPNTPGVYSCPNDRDPTAQVQMIFDKTAGGTETATYLPEDCAGSVRIGTGPRLQPSAALIDQLTSLNSIPPF